MAKFRKYSKASKDEIKRLIPSEHQKYEEGKLIILDKDLSLEQLEMMKHELKFMIDHKYSMSVIYNPNCGCPVDVFIELDRYPMSKKIHHSCKICKKGVLLEISDPIIFYCPLLNKDIQLHELKDYYLDKDTKQGRILAAYRD